jgi:hypothetical protein
MRTCNEFVHFSTWAKPIAPFLSHRPYQLISAALWGSAASGTTLAFRRPLDESRRGCLEGSMTSESMPRLRWASTARISSAPLMGIAHASSRELAANFCAPYTGTSPAYASWRAARTREMSGTSLRAEVVASSRHESDAASWACGWWGDVSAVDAYCRGAGESLLRGVVQVGDLDQHQRRGWPFRTAAEI